MIDRRSLLRNGALAGAAATLAGRSAAEAAAVAPPTSPSSTVPAFELDELTVVDLQKRMASGADSAKSLSKSTSRASRRVDRSGPALRAVLETNPDALAIAAALDAERKAGKVRGPAARHPVLVKDNIGTADRMTTTAGSLALDGCIPAADAFVVEEAARRGRDPPRQDEPLRVGQLPLDALLERAGAAAAASAAIRTRSTAIASGSSSGSGAGDGGELCRGLDRHGDRRLDRVAVQQLRPRGLQAHGRPGEPLGHRPDLAHPGHRRADVPHRGRRRRSCSRPSRGSIPPTPRRRTSRARRRDYTRFSTRRASKGRASASPARSSSARAPRRTGSSRRRSPT